MRYRMQGASSVESSFSDGLIEGAGFLGLRLFVSVARGLVFGCVDCLGTAIGMVVTVSNE